MTDTGEISETQAREVAEQAREAQWRQPSFGKELFLGRLRLDLVHPHPSGLPEAAERGEAFLARLREFCESQIDAAMIERDAQIPDKVILGLKELGALGMKIETEYGGLGLSQVYYNKALALVCSVHPAWAHCSPRTSRLGYRSRSRCSGPLTRSTRGCPGVHVRSARSSSPNRMSAVTRPGCTPPPHRTAMTMWWTG